MNLTLEIQEHLAQRQNSFKPQYVSVIAAMLSHTAIMTATTVGSGDIPSSRAQLETKEFDMFMEKADTDLNAYQVWLESCRNIETNTYFTKLKWSRDRRRDAAMQVDKLLDDPVAPRFVFFDAQNAKVELLYHEITSLRTRIATKDNHKSYNGVFVLHACKHHKA